MGKIKNRLSKCQFFVVQNWGVFFGWLGFNPQMFSRVEGLESIALSLNITEKVGIDHSLSTEKVL